MDRTSSSTSISSNLHRTDPPNMLALPAENLAMIIEFIDKADNQTLSHLAQSCTQLWHAAGTDALISFFYTAKDRFDQADTGKKVAIFSLLSSWLPMVSHQMPDESRLQIIEHLSSMAKLEAGNKADQICMINSIGPLLEICRNEMNTMLELFSKSRPDYKDEVILNRMTSAAAKLSSTHTRQIEALSLSIKSDQGSDLIGDR